MLYQPEAFEPLTEQRWNESFVRAGIERIVRDADEALRGPRLLWKADAWDGWHSTSPMKNLYGGAAGVLWALNELRTRGQAETRLDLADLYKMDGRYAYSGGWNWRAIVAVFIGVVPVLPGFLKAATTPGFEGVFQNPTFIEGLYNYGLFFTFFVAGAAYLLSSLITSRAPEVAEDREAVPE
jgi:hypothetical protein